jgi:hypothetical protein
MELKLPRQTKRRILTRARQPIEGSAIPNIAWGLDFMSDLGAAAIARCAARVAGGVTWFDTPTSQEVTP